MTWFLNLSTRVKLFFGFGLMILFLATVIMTAYTGITAIQESQHRLYEVEFANTADLLTFESNQNEVRAALLTMMGLTRKSDQEFWHQVLMDRAKTNDAILQRLFGQIRNDPQSLRRLEELKAAREAFIQTRDSQVIPLIYEGKSEEAKKLSLGVQADRFKKMRAIGLELVNEAEERARTAVTRSEQRARDAIRFFVGVGGIAVLLGVVMAAYLNRTPTRSRASRASLNRSRPEI